MVDDTIKGPTKQFFFVNFFVRYKANWQIVLKFLQDVYFCEILFWARSDKEEEPPNTYIGKKKIFVRPNFFLIIGFLDFQTDWITD